jgi:hypothetical protein
VPSSHEAGELVTIVDVKNLSGTKLQRYSAAATPFGPGVYTVAFADEWGQAVLLHFSVEA